jgi:DMSO/TMAO reductase YedYZ heme-binding membrane subunit
VKFVTLFIMRRHLIIRLFQAGHVVLSLLVVVMAGLVVMERVEIGTVRTMGGQMAKLSVVMLAITLLPGIVRRLKIGLFISRFLMPYRRHLGIATYLLAMGHAVLNFYLPNYRVLGTPLPASLPKLFILMGLMALVLLTPLFVTSNDWAVRTLGKWWGRIHKLVYVVVLFVLLHLSLMQSPWRFLAGGILGLEIGSFVVAGVRGWRGKQVKAEETELHRAI